MKKFLLLSVLILAVVIEAKSQAGYEFKQVSTIESVVPGGGGRSRLISTDEKGQEEELTLENFFSIVGINFGNIRNNDKVISDKITTLAKEGWELYSVNTGVYSTDKGLFATGIFITRYLFKRPRK